MNKQETDKWVMNLAAGSMDSIQMQIFITTLEINYIRTAIQKCAEDIAWNSLKMAFKDNNDNDEKLHKEKEELEDKLKELLEKLDILMMMELL